jgi:hypothetical protein
MTRDPARAPDHPIVELGYDLWDGFGRALADSTGRGADGSSRYEHMRSALHAARRLVAALELVVDDLEAEAHSTPPESANSSRVGGDDFQIIAIDGG